MCGESRIPKRWCNEILTCWVFHYLWLNCHQRWQLCAHPWTHTGTGLNRCIILHNNLTEKSCFLSQSTVVCCMTGTSIKRARSKVNILCATGSWSGTSYGTLLTYSMVQSPSWEANWFAANQEIRRISRSPKVHYRTHKRPPPLSILGQPNPVHLPTTHLLEIRPNIIHPSTPRSPQWSLSLQFPHQYPIHPSLLTNTRHMPSPSHSSRFYHPHNIGWGVQK